MQPDDEKSRPPIQLYDDMSAVDTVRVGIALEEMVATDGWRLFRAQVERMSNKAARDGLRSRSPEYPREYYAGAMDLLEELIGGVNRVIAHGQDVKRQREVTTLRGIPASGTGSLAE